MEIYWGEHQTFYDVMNNTEFKKIKGLLMFIDLEKTFDSVSWKFMYNVLRYYNFSEEFIKWITRK